MGLAVYIKLLIITTATLILFGFSSTPKINIAPDLQEMHYEQRTIWAPATTYKLGSNIPKAIVIHTSEEPVDDRESAVEYFRLSNTRVSSHYYIDSDGDIYQLVRDSDSAIAQGVTSETAVVPRPSWHTPGKSYNSEAISIEIEGYHYTIANTLKVYDVQFKSLVNLVAYKAYQYDIPIDREHIVGHNQLSNVKRDPGALFPWKALINFAKEKVKEYRS